MGRKVHVAHRQQVFARHIGVSRTVREVPRQAARLAARSAVAAALGHRPREEAAAAVPHADRTVHETLHLGRRCGADRPDFVERQRPFENHAREPRLAQESGTFRRAVRHLRRGMELHRKIHPPISHILDDQGVDPRGDQFAGLCLGRFQFAVPQQRVERRVDPHAVTVGIFDHAGDLLRRVPGRLPRTETRAADIDGIGAVIHSRDGRSVIFGRCEQFDGFHNHAIFGKNKINL